MNTRSLALATALPLVLAPMALAQVSEETLDSIAAPDAIETRIGTLEFTDGVPSVETAEKARDALAFTRAALY